MKIDKSAKNACTVLSIAEVINVLVIIVYIGVCVALAVLVAYYGWGGFLDILMQEDTLTALGGIIPNIDTYQADTLIGILIIYLVTSFIYLILSLRVLMVTESFFKETRTALTPFVIQNAKRIKSIALLVLAASIIPMIITKIGFSVLQIQQVSPWTFGEGTVLALILLSIGTLFEYGCELQKESDETI